MWDCTLTVLYDGTEYRTFIGTADTPIKARERALQDAADWMVNYDGFEVVKEEYA